MELTTQKLAPFLEIPLEILCIIRTKREATVLLSIGSNARQFDSLVQEIMLCVNTAHNLTENSKSPSDNMSNISALMCFLSEASLVNEQVHQSLKQQMNECRVLFQSLRELLECHIDSNLTAANEFSEAECFKLAATKRLIYDFEYSIMMRLDFLLGNVPSPASSNKDMWTVTLHDQIYSQTDKWQ
jgi:hypothetical protein